MSAIRCSLLFALLLSACNNFPKDAEGTLTKVTNGTIHAGTTISTTRADSNLIEGFAGSIGAQLVWHTGDQYHLARKLADRNIDMAIGGFTEKSPLKEIVAFTNPYAHVNKEHYVIAIPKGENAFLMKLEQFLYEHRQQ